MPKKEVLRLNYYIGWSCELTVHPIGILRPAQDVPAPQEWQDTDEEVTFCGPHAESGAHRPNATSCLVSVFGVHAASVMRFG